MAGVRAPAPPKTWREEEFFRRGLVLVAGVDEVGRGPLAGPVVAAAVILEPGWPDPGVADSKTLSAPRREKLDAQIRATARAWAVGEASPAEIDRLNILRASLLAMVRAVEALGVEPEFLLIDGNHSLPLELPQEAVVKGDSLCRSVAAASIVAKVRRDRMMREFHQRYPAYNFAANKGYGTAEHQRALAEHGPCPLHRQSFAPVAQQSFAWSGSD
ncbi:MAG: ribonuclease HII [Deltaproteobacteria bacterium]|nr:ribonuclease HII [Deltaproteobacteria bacterium]